MKRKKSRHTEGKQRESEPWGFFHQGTAVVEHDTEDRISSLSRKELTAGLYLF